jgi:PTS system N-acetylglucosamine-specific IIC component
VRALGGPANLRTVDACTTRLRLVVADQSAVKESELKALGARGCLRSDDTLQVVVGPIADQLASDIRAHVKSGGAAAPTRLAVRDLLEALGGAANLKEVRLAASRILVTLNDAAALKKKTLEALALRGLAQPSPQTVHVLIGPAAADVARELDQLRAGA